MRTDEWIQVAKSRANGGTYRVRGQMAQIGFVLREFDFCCALCSSNEVGAETFEYKHTNKMTKNVGQVFGT